MTPWDTLQEREKKKLLEKETWFLPKPDEMIEIIVGRKPLKSQLLSACDFARSKIKPNLGYRSWEIEPLNCLANSTVVFTVNFIHPWSC